MYGQNTRGGVFAFGLIFNSFFLTCPIFIHQFYFLYQAFEVSLALLLGILGAYFIRIWAVCEKLREKSWYLWAGIACMVWSFGMYQVLVPYYIAINAAFFFLDYFFGEERKGYFKICLKLVGAFLLGLALYFLAARIYAYVRFHQMSAALTESYLAWGKIPFSQCIDNICGDFRRVWKLELPVFSKGYPVFTALFAGFCLWRGIFQKKKQWWLLIPAAAIFILSPFFMTFLLGNYQILRAQLVYPFVFAATTALLYLLLPEKKWVRLPMAACCAVLVFSHIDISNRYAQMIHVTAQADQELAYEIYREADKLRDEADDPEAPFVFVGGKFRHEIPPVYPGQWDAAGISFFDIDNGYLQGSRRIARLMGAMGLQTTEPSKEQFAFAKEMEGELAVWPKSGSCVYENGMVVIKLAESQEE